jgi:hypothetical protein
MIKTHTVTLGRAVKIPHDATVTGEGKGSFTRVSRVLCFGDHRLASNAAQTLTVTTAEGDVIKYKFTRSSKPCPCGVEHSVSLY